MKNMNIHSEKKGFTLIELLVAIAIIAILAAILFPVFARARENARRSSCMSNMKQLGLGLMQYTQDYDEKFPKGYMNGTIGTGGWAGCVYPYIKSGQVFTCPSDVYQLAIAGKSVMSYAMNDSLLGDGNGGTATSPGASLAAMNSPTLTVLLCETQNNETDLALVGEGFSPAATGSNNFYAGKPSPGGTNDSYATGALPGQTLKLSPTFPNGRHLEGSNWLAADGHVKWLKGSKISGGKDATNATDVQVNNTRAAGTQSMDNGGGANSAALTFSKN